MTLDNLPYWATDSGKALKRYKLDEPSPIGNYLKINSDESAKTWFKDCEAFAGKYKEKTGVELLLMIPSPDGLNIDIIDYWSK